LYRTVTSTANGSYSDRYFPDRIGPWTVKASWEGDQTSDKAVSVSISFYLSPYLDHPITFGGATYHLATSSNSSISSLSFNQTQKEIRFTVNGPADTIGYNNITIPKELLSGALVVKIDGNQINPTITQNGTHAFVYCTYAHSLHQVKIVGTTIIPEFPTITSITMLLTILALTLIFTKRKMIRY
jgi:hypothetical protein